MKGVGRVEQFTDLVERMLSLIFVPATIYGASGAFLRVGRGKRSCGQVVFEVFGGAITAHMFSEIINAQVPMQYHSVCFFLVGWGGLEFVGRLYEAVANGLESRVRGSVSGSNKGEE